MEILPEMKQIARLQPPAGICRMVLDTDAYNEVDDQFALAYALLSPERIRLEAAYAAPFFNHRSSGPEDGMIKSYDEIRKILDMMGRRAEPAVFRGSAGYLLDEKTPRPSEAASDLVRRARAAGEEPLYVVAIGAATNIASALLAAPEIREKIVVVWLGGHAPGQADNGEFNLRQDIAAARVLFDSGVPLVWLPCAGVVDRMVTTVPELACYLEGKNTLCDYLVNIVRGFTDRPYGWSKVLWDPAAVAWLVQPEWLPSLLIHSPRVTDIGYGGPDPSRHLIRRVSCVYRDDIFADIFHKLSSMAG